jgi:hypothetical protein
MAGMGGQALEASYVDLDDVAAQVQSRKEQEERLRQREQQKQAQQIALLQQQLQNQQEIQQQQQQIQLLQQQQQAFARGRSGSGSPTKASRPLSATYEVPVPVAAQLESRTFEPDRMFSDQPFNDSAPAAFTNPLFSAKSSFAGFNIGSGNPSAPTSFEFDDQDPDFGFADDGGNDDSRGYLSIEARQATIKAPKKAKKPKRSVSPTSQASSVAPHHASFGKAIPYKGDGFDEEDGDEDDVPPQVQPTQQTDGDDDSLLDAGVDVVKAAPKKIEKKEKKKKDKEADGKEKKKKKEKDPEKKEKKHKDKPRPSFPDDHSESGIAKMEPDDGEHVKPITKPKSALKVNSDTTNGDEPPLKKKGSKVSFGEEDHIIPAPPPHEDEPPPEPEPVAPPAEEQV